MVKKRGSTPARSTLVTAPAGSEDRSAWSGGKAGRNTAAMKPWASQRPGDRTQGLHSTAGFPLQEETGVDELGLGKKSWLPPSLRACHRVLGGGVGRGIPKLLYRSRMRGLVCADGGHRAPPRLTHFGLV